jgi:nucleotide-binding universal stress UspA family protein
MPESTRSKRTSLEAVEVMPGILRSVLISIDLAPGSERVAGRAALLPLAGDARLTLLHVVPKRLPREARRRAEDDARKALELEAKRLSRMLPRSAVVQQAVKAGAPAAEIARHAGAVKAELVVMGRGGGRPVRDAFLGSTAERVIRQGQLPVLVVRRPPRTPYRQPAIALALDEAAHDVLALLLRVIPPPRPQVALIHAYDAPLEGAIYPSLSAEEAEVHRRYYRGKARQELALLLATLLAEAKIPPRAAPSWRTHVRHGPPRSVIERTVKTTGADLLVLGTHGYSGVAHAFLGTVAGDVLREVRCDVLVVPPRRKTQREA